MTSPAGNATGMSVRSTSGTTLPLQTWIDQILAMSLPLQVTAGIDAYGTKFVASDGSPQGGIWSHLGSTDYGAFIGTVGAGAAVVAVSPNSDAGWSIISKGSGKFFAGNYYGPLFTATRAADATIGAPTLSSNTWGIGLSVTSTADTDGSLDVLHVAIVPQGGGLCLRVPDGSTSGGNRRGFFGRP